MDFLKDSDEEEVPKVPVAVAKKFTVEELYEIIQEAMESGSLEDDRRAKWAARILEARGQLDKTVDDVAEKKKPLKEIVQEIEALARKKPLQRMLQKGNVKLSTIK